MQGMMMDYPLTLLPILERANRLFGKKQIVTRIGGETVRVTYAELYGGSSDWPARWPRSASSAATGSRRSAGTISSTWSCTSRCRAWAPCCTRSTFACSSDQIAFILNDAEDKVIVVDESLLPLLDQILPKTPGRQARPGRRRGARRARRTIDGRPVTRYEDALAAAPAEYAVPAA